MNEEEMPQNDKGIICPPPAHEPYATLRQALANTYPLAQPDTTKEELELALALLNPAEQQRLAEEVYKVRLELHQAQLKSALEKRRRPGILDRISSCESSEAAHTMFHEFLDSANAVSQKTINRAKKLLATIDFPLP